MVCLTVVLQVVFLDKQHLVHSETLFVSHSPRFPSTPRCVTLIIKSTLIVTATIKTTNSKAAEYSIRTI